MTVTSETITSIDHLCATWESAAAVAEVSNPVVCSSALILQGASVEPRFCYIGVASPIEQLLSEDTTLHDRQGSRISSAELFDRLLSGEVAAVLAPRGPLSLARHHVEPGLPTELVSRRQALRDLNVRARFLLRQIGLEEVSSHRGAAADLYSSLAALWSPELAICIDPAMMLTLGADRQRHVDAHYEERAKLHLPRALGRLNDVGVSGYPRLVII